MNLRLYKNKGLKPNWIFAELPTELKHGAIQKSIQRHERSVSYY